MQSALNANTTGIQPAEPISREDALAKRLKSLREGRDQTPSPAAQDPPPPYSETVGGSPSPRNFSQRLRHASPPAKKSKVEPSSASPSDRTGADPAQDADEDDTLAEILDGLVLDDDQWSMSEDDGDQGASKRVEELLANLGRKAQTQDSEARDEMDQDPKKDDEDDDSEGDEMTRQTDDILARTMDELEYEGHKQPPDSNKASDPPDPEKADPDSDLALPAVPHTPTEEDEPLPDLPNTANNNDEAGISLPEVPTILQDPVPASKAPDDPFESAIAARLAALKGPGHKPFTTDDFGLPSAPTFQPEDRPLPKLAKKPGFSDEDMKTWCVVCLEDATVRCVGCDGDVYCARCWREMHVGPSAGYDERGHAWEKFDPRKL